MHDQRARNILGAAALTVSDLMLLGATSAVGVSASASAALVVLSTMPGRSVTELGQRIGLSQPAAARMVDSLAARGLARRAATPTRSVAVHLTEAGVDAVARILRSRDEALAAIVGVLDEAEQDALAGLLGTMLSRAYDRLPGAARLCRLCDRACCVADEQTCPVGQAERARAGADDG